MFKEPSLQNFFEDWMAGLNSFFRRLLEVQINDRLVGEYELKRTLCCLSGQTINLIGLPLTEKLDPTTYYLFNPTDIVSSRHAKKKSKEPPNKSNFLRIDH